MNQNNELRRVLLRYAQARMTHIAQLVVCNRYHSIEQRLCLLLLQSLDRLDGNNVVLTHEMIAKMLGVRRESITESAGKLQKSGAISCSRGNTALRDRDKLVSHSCECYATVKKEENRLFPLPGELAYKAMRFRAGFKPVDRATI